MIAFLSLVLSCAAFPLTTSSPAALRLLKSPSARCLDGTQAGYYIRAGSASSTSWVFSLEGGGECVSKDDCLNRANSTLGSSKSWLPTTELGQYQANDPIWNPRFFNAHHVFVKYVAPLPSIIFCNTLAGTAPATSSSGGSRSLAAAPTACISVAVSLSKPSSTSCCPRAYHLPALLCGPETLQEALVQ